MKKKKNIEMRIYEILGIKTFRKMAFAICDKILISRTKNMTKEERKDYLYHRASNYSIGKINSLEDIQNFKRKLFSNALIHSIGVASFILIFIMSGTGTITSNILELIFNSIFGVINLYCVMLQRYNCIRINQLIKRMMPRYEKQKETIKEELRKENSLLNEHTYKIVDKNEKETIITFEELIANATIEQLNKYREYLQNINQACNENTNISKEKQVGTKMPIENNKTLKLEFDNNVHYTKGDCIMKDEKDFIVEMKDNQKELVTEKRKKQTGIIKYCVFASSVVLFGAITGISLNNNKYKDDVNIESTSSTNSLDNSNDIENTSNINNESEQLYGIVGYKPIYKEQIVHYEDENRKWEECRTVIVGYEPIYGYISDSSLETKHLSKTK